MSHVLNDRCIDKMLTRRETAAFMDEPACRGEKVNRYDSPSGNVLSLKQGFKGFVIFFSHLVFAACFLRVILDLPVHLALLEKKD